MHLTAKSAAFIEAANDEFGFGAVGRILKPLQLESDLFGQRIDCGSSPIAQMATRRELMELFENNALFLRNKHYYLLHNHHYIIVNYTLFDVESWIEAFCLRRTISDPNSNRMLDLLRHRIFFVLNFQIQLLELKKINIKNKMTRNSLNDL